MNRTECIRVSPITGAVKSMSNSSSHAWQPSNLGPADRYRRLIPYMTFYIPTNEYNLPNENYKQSATGPNTDAYEQSVVKYGHQIRLNPVSSTTPQPAVKHTSSRQTSPKTRYKYKENVIQAIAVNRRPIKLSSIDAYQHQPTQQQQSLHEQGLSGYNTIQYQPVLKQQQHQLPQIHQSKVVYTPFLPSNQIPGAFRPIIPNEQYETNQPNSVNINTVNNQYQIEVEQEPVVPEQQRPQNLIEVIPSTPKPFYLTTKYEQIHPSSQQQQQQQQHQRQPLTEPQREQQQQQQQPLASYVAYLRPQPQYVPVVKTTQRPTIAAEEEDHQQQYVYHVESAPAPAPATTRKPTIKVYKNSYKIQTHSEPQIKPETGRLAGNEQSDALYATVNYDLDPNDGYSSRVPANGYRLAVTTSNRNPTLTKIKNPYVSAYKTIELVSSTPAPTPAYASTKAPQISISTPTPQYEYESVPVSAYQTTPVPFAYTPMPTPAIVTTTTPETRQHLTETTQIRTPTEATFHPSHHQEDHQHDHQYVYKVSKLNSVPKYKTTVLNRVPVVDEPHYIIRPTAAAAVQPSPVIDYAINTTSIASILKKLQDTNHLPQTITPDNIDNSIRTLVKILSSLKTSQKVVDSPSQHYADNNNGGEDYEDNDSNTNGEVRDGTPGPNTGRPGIDYPALAEIPSTSFNCKEQRYKGFFGDPETHCQVWHYCDLNGGQASFLCPNGTIFSQVSLTCDWWFNVKCSTTAQLYVLNERLYKYILPFSPKFPEDYSGPLVDKYLAIKFQEMEEKMNREKNKNRVSNSDDSPSATEITAPVADEDVHSHDIDMAEQLPTAPSGDDGANNYLSDIDIAYDDDKEPEHTTPFRTVIVTSAPETKLHAIGHERISQPIEVESEKLEVIEIRSDGSSGHLTPGRQ